MSDTKRDVLLLPLTALMTTLAITSILHTQSAYTQQDYEELIMTETDINEKLQQENIGSGSSPNIECGINIVDSNSPQQLTCPNITGETPAPGTIIIPVVTQREGPVVTASGSGTEDIAESRAVCLADEVVTGGGWERIDTLTASQNRGIIKENKEGNEWVVTGSSTFQPITFKAYAECLRLISS